MDNIKNYSIPFIGLKPGMHQFTFHINQAFFDLFETEKEFTDSDITAKVMLNKHSTFLEMQIITEGSIELTCDLSNEKFQHNIENEIDVLVKFGEEYDDSDTDVIIIPRTDGEFNVAQLIYEDVMLSVPMKKIAPNAENSEEFSRLLEKFSPKDEEQSEPDPRWDALKSLKDKN